MPEGTEIENKPVTQAELQKTSEAAMTALSEVKNMLDENKESIQKLDFLDETKFNKLAEDVAKAIETSQQADQEAKAAIAAAGRFGKAEGESKGDEVLDQYTENLRAYLKSGSRNAEDNLVKFSNENIDHLAKSFGIKPHTKAMDSISNPDGGYLMPNAVQRLVVTRQFETSPMRELAEVITLADGDSVDFVADNDEADAGWISEIGTRTETSTPETDLITIVAEEVYAEPKATQKLLDRAAINIEEWLGNKIASKIARVENTAFVNGNGAGKPKGFLQYTTTTSAAYSGNSIELIASGASANVTYAGLVNLQSALKEAYQANAKFAYKRSLNALLMKVVDGDSRPIFNLMFDKNTGVEPTIMGKGARFFDDMPAAGADSKSIAYADFAEAYKIVDAGNLTILRDPYTQKGFVKFFARTLTGGGVVNFEAIKLQNLNT